MSTGQTFKTVSTGLDGSLALAAAVGRKLHGGEVIELVSDLGGGKTSFVKGLAAGLGSPDHVHSPSFTVSNQYKAGGLTLHHFDFHRLNEPGIMRDELAEIIQDPANIVVIEWPDIIEDVLPADRLSIKIVPVSANGRQFIFTYPEKLSYLIPRNT